MFRGRKQALNALTKLEPSLAYNERQTIEDSTKRYIKPCDTVEDNSHSIKRPRLQKSLSIESLHTSKKQEEVCTSLELVSTDDYCVTMIEYEDRGNQRVVSEALEELRNQLLKENDCNLRECRRIRKCIHSCRLIHTRNIYSSSPIYYVIFLKKKILVWNLDVDDDASQKTELRGSKSMHPISLPEEIDQDSLVYVFLLELYGDSISLLLMTQAGDVFFWETIEDAYGMIPAKTRIPLQKNERLITNESFACRLVPCITDEELNSTGNARKELDDRENMHVNIVCWSCSGEIWEISVRDRHLQVESLERRNESFFGGIAKSVTQLLFSPTQLLSRQLAPDPTTQDDSNRCTDEIQAIRFPDAKARVHITGKFYRHYEIVLLLYRDGSLQLRNINSSNLRMTMCGQGNIKNIARVCFHSNFPSLDLRNSYITGIAYFDGESFIVSAAFVCFSDSSECLQMKYALLQFKTSDMALENSNLRPSWVSFQDYSPHLVGVDVCLIQPHTEMELLIVSKDALYIVWPQADPVRAVAVSLNPQNTKNNRIVELTMPRMPGSYQDVAYGALIQRNNETQKLKGSLTMLLLDLESRPVKWCIRQASATMFNSLESENSERSYCEEQIKYTHPRYTTDRSVFLTKGASIRDYFDQLVKHFGAESDVNIYVGSEDIENATYAALAINFQFLNSSPSSGLRWDLDSRPGTCNMNRTESDSTLMSSRLIRLQLEEKKEKVLQFELFLRQRCPMIWNHLQHSSEILRQYNDDREKLFAALALCTFQTSIPSKDSDSAQVSSKLYTGRTLLASIRHTVQKNRNYTDEELHLAGYSALDIFYCEISRIGELFQSLSFEVQKPDTSSADYISALVECNASMLTMLQGASFTSQQIYSTALTESWLFTQPMRELLISQIVRSTDIFVPLHLQRLQQSIKIPLTLTEMFVIATQIKDIGSIFLKKFALVLAAATKDQIHSLQAEFILAKQSILNPLIYAAAVESVEFRQELSCNMIMEEKNRWKKKQMQLFEDCVELCESYSYFEGMIFLVTRKKAEMWSQLDYVINLQEEHAAVERLTAYCESHQGFATFLYKWIAGQVQNPWVPHEDEDVQGLQSFHTSTRKCLLILSISHPDLCKPELHSFLLADANLKQYAWMTAVTRNCYDEASTLVFDENAKKCTDIHRRKTLSSIAMINALAVPTSSQSKAKVLDIQRELTRSRIQEVLLQLPGSIAASHRPQTFSELISACLNAMQGLDGNDPLRLSLFMMCLKALESIHDDTSLSDVDPIELYIRVWRWCILEDQEVWEHLRDNYSDSVNEEALEQGMRETLMYSAMSQYDAFSTQNSAALTKDGIDLLLNSDTDVGSIFSKSSRQIFMKALDLAVTESANNSSIADNE